MKESELFDPICDYYRQMGFEVDGEVKSIDMVCHHKKEDVTVVIELKNTINLKLITQAALRQKLFDYVYVGVWTPKNLRSKDHQNKVYLLKRLGIGLIYVSPKLGKVSIAHEPLADELLIYQQRNKRKRQAVLKEFQKRQLKQNQGGIHNTKIVTAYMEQCLILLKAMASGDSMKVGHVRELTGIKRCNELLYKNHYGWFQNVSRGYYALSTLGRDALVTYADYLAQLERLERLEGKDDDSWKKGL